MARILVFGAGAIGAYFGAALQRAGNDVLFVARGANLEALSSSGLRVTGAMGDFALEEVSATQQPSGEFDLVLLCVKNYDLDEAAEPLRSCSGLVITLQNGVEAPYRARTLVGDRVLAGTTGIVSDLPEPGHVHVVSAYAWMRFGEPDGGGITGRVQRATRWLTAIGVEPLAEADVRIALWQKMALMCGMAGLTTLHQRPMGEILGDPALRRTFVQLVRECEAVARARGIELPDDFSDERMRYAEQIDPEAMSSMSRDFARGRRIEVDTFNGALVRMGAEAGVRTPRNADVYDAIRKAAQTAT
jgi:2-dehydropantoate 2-reductase